MKASLQFKQSNGMAKVLAGLAFVLATELAWAGDLTSTPSNAPAATMETSPAQGVCSPTITLEPKQVQMGDWLTVTVNNCSPALTKAIDDRQNILLYLGDFPLRGLLPTSCVVSNANTKLQYHLEWTDSSSTNWLALLHKPHFGFLTLKVGLGLENGSVLATTTANESSLTFYALPNWQVALWGLFLLAFTVCFVWMWGWSQLLRDSGPDPGKGQYKSYSLARVQMAIWFFLVIGAFVFLRVITGGAEVAITNTVLSLIGIGAGTALGAAVQDGNKFSKLQSEKAALQSKARSPDEENRLQVLNVLLADRGDLEKEKERLEAVPAPSQAQQDRLAQVKNLLNQALPVHISHGFFEDILTDDVGLSFHRFQMFVWTLVLAVFFISDVVNNLAMPEFGNTLLALMGISSGTYLGFSLTEPHSSEMTIN